MLYTVCLYVVYSMSLCCIQYVSLLYTVCLSVVYSMSLCCIQYASLFYTVCLSVVYSMSLCCIQYVSMLYTVCLYVVYSMSLITRLPMHMFIVMDHQLTLWNLYIILFGQLWILLQIFLESRHRCLKQIVQSISEIYHARLSFNKQTVL